MPPYLIPEMVDVRERQSKSWAAARDGKEASPDAKTFPVSEIGNAAAAFLLPENGNGGKSFVGTKKPCGMSPW